MPASGIGFNPEWMCATAYILRVRVSINADNLRGFLDQDCEIVRKAIDFTMGRRNLLFVVRAKESPVGEQSPITSFRCLEWRKRPCEWGFRWIRVEGWMTEGLASELPEVMPFVTVEQSHSSLTKNTGKLHTCSLSFWPRGQYINCYHYHQ